MNDLLYKTYSVDELYVNYGTVSLDKCGLFLCRTGNADVLMNNHSYHIVKGGLVLYTPYTFIRVVRRSDDFDGYLMETDLDVLAIPISQVPVMDRLFIRNHPCIQLLPEQSRRIEQMTDILDSRHERMLRATSSRSVKLLRLVTQSLIQAFLLELMDIYFDSFPVEELRQDREERIFNAFLMSVHRHCDKNRSVVFYADEQHLSPNYLSSVVKAKSGQTAIQWIETITLVHTKHYLGSTKLSVKEIAEKLNFPDQSTFGRYFKKHCGMSPTEYRKQINPLHKSEYKRGKAT